jgi:phage tail sheath protein FI
VFDAATSWSESNNGFVVVDTDPDLTVAQAVSFAGSLTDSSNAAVYFPHLYIADPLGRGAGALRKIGPAGAVAGLYLATDASRGVFKAPAGIGSAIQGIVSVEKSFSSAELDTMNASTSPVNPIRQIPGAGLSVMGARTLKQDGTANKYVNMRRSLIYIRKNIKNLTEFAIFENNEEKLWAQIRTVLNVFLGEYRNQGGLRGTTPAQAYFVKCDAENNSAQSIANGEVHIQVGVALQYPAEFIVIDLSQKTLN